MSSPLIFESSDEENYQPPNIKLLCDKLDNSSDIPDLVSGSEESTEEHKRVNRIRTLLMGVPPPPAVTVSQYDAKEILDHLKDNFEAFMWTDSKVNSPCMKNKIDSLVNGEWPNILNEHWFNVSYNRGLDSEELALLTVKYQERYIGNETSSSVNSFFTKSPIRTASAKKRARRHAWGHSPGRRLSHLARRRHTFSSANLQQNASKSLPDKKKMILIERRKAQAIKRGRNSATKAAGSAKAVRSVSTVNTKRALFQSPENEKKNASLLSGRCRSSPRIENVQRSKRALWPEKPDVDKENGLRFNFSSSGKRRAEALIDSSANKKKCFRSLSFTEEKASSTSSAMPSLVVEDLSQLHRKKLLWAVSDALRKEGIGMEHSLSKLCMSELFRICKELWMKKCAKEEKSGSTSDRMLEIANKYSSDVVRRVKIRSELLKSSDNNSMALSDKTNPSSNIKKCSSKLTITDKCESGEKTVHDFIENNSAESIQTVCRKNRNSLVSRVDKLDKVDKNSSTCNSIRLSSNACDNETSKLLSVNDRIGDCKIQSGESDCDKLIIDSCSKIKTSDGVFIGSDCKLNTLQNCNKRDDVSNNSTSCPTNVPLVDVYKDIINCSNAINDKDVNNSSNICNEEFSPTLNSNNETGKFFCLSNCDIDMDKIICSIRSDDESD